jgi:hypothetical protein
MARIAETAPHITVVSLEARYVAPTSKYGGNSQSVGCVQNSNNRFAIDPTL